MPFSLVVVFRCAAKRTLQPMPGPLLTVDTPWLLYRSYFALPASITDSEDRPVNALLGTVNAILTAVEAVQPRAVVACFGCEQAAYRVKLYPPYHAHRDPMPAELAHQWHRAPALLERLGWVVTDTDELEADDLMGSHARVEAQAGGEALILTGDRDLYQAVDERVAVLELRRQGPPGRIDVAEVRRRYGVVRDPGGDDRRRPAPASPCGRGPARKRRAPSPLPGDRDPGGGAGHPAAGPTHRLRRRRERGPRAGDGSPRWSPGASSTGWRMSSCSSWPPTRPGS